MRSIERGMNEFYYIIELSNGVRFAVSTYELDKLPEDTIGFSIISQKGESTIPSCYSVKMGRVFHDAKEGIDKAYFNGDTIAVQANTSFARNYETLNAAFVNSRALHDVLSR